MKKAFLFFLALVLSLSMLSGAFAQSEQTPILGGTKAWPEFRGMQFGLSSTAVLSHEADARLSLLCPRNDGEPVSLDEAASAKAYPVLSAGLIDAFGKDAYLRYEFQSGAFAVATLYWPVSSAQEALEWTETVRAQAEAAYGAPDESSLLTAEGDRVPTDPEDEYYTLFEDSIENYPDATPFFGWNLGKAFTFSDDGAEAQEGLLSVYTKTVEANSLEAGIGLEAGTHVVVLNVSRPFFAQAVDTSLFE